QVDANLAWILCPVRRPASLAEAMGKVIACEGTQLRHGFAVDRPRLDCEERRVLRQNAPLHAQANDLLDQFADAGALRVWLAIRRAVGAGEADLLQQGADASGGPQPRHESAVGAGQLPGLEGELERL